MRCNLIVHYAQVGTRGTTQMFQTADPWTSDDSLILAREGSIQDYAIVALAAIVLYDYIITFRDEVQLFWQHKSNVVDALFYLNRYGTLIFGIINGASGYFRGKEVTV
ncbi:hypothetical protein PHLGIDRAFT_230998 [Phlebiopsis gigantea 11061_1 CR5-6]|uniref:DUF6533 domain-containing protein n=1 Tax=Phlebiopsis gigantea (strain 11061_1 CR5-6) TaxID=745531 RepID=A0A0C3S457_PHLG1|nr:hypothetical protein PHLGIDRAFT_230998 [Phlebiopsis gigantea 11061_1 CR5-6]